MKFISGGFAVWQFSVASALQSTMGCYLCQNDYDNVHTRAFICTLQYACQHPYTHLQYYAAWDVNNYDLRQHNYTLTPNNMHIHVHIMYRLVGTHNINYG